MRSEIRQGLFVPNAGRGDTLAASHDASLAVLKARPVTRGNSAVSAVPKVGVEPTRLFRTTDFESAASASSATSACREVSCS